MKNLKLSTLLTAGVFALFSANASALILSFESSTSTTQEPEMTTTVAPESVRDAAHAKKDALDHRAAVQHLLRVAKSDERKKVKEDKEN